MSFIRFIKISVNFKMRHLRKSFRKKSFRLLDVGSGNHSATRITNLFPHCEYYGLDLNKDYNNNENDFSRMKGFYELDLTKLEYSKIPDLYFDGIWMAHVIEHISNGEMVLPLLLQKLKPGGFFYLEYPGKKSLSLPSMRGTLNFNDDPTHLRVYSVPELKKVFLSSDCNIRAAGTRRNWYYIIFLPLRAVISFFKKGYVEGNVFWDIFGFAEYLWVQKNNIDTK